MALKVKLVSDELAHIFESAYLKISELGVAKDVLHIIVNIYTNEDARKKQQQAENLTKQVDLAQEKTMRAKAELDSHLEDLHKNSEELNKAQTAAEAGKLDKDKLKDVEKRTQKFLDEVWNSALKDLSIAKTEEQKLRDELAQLPIINPLKTEKYSFGVTEDELNRASIYKVAYDKLKSVPSLKTSADA